MNDIHSEQDHLSLSGSSEAFQRLFELAVVLGTYMERELAERGLTRARATVLWELYHHGPMTQRALSQALRVTPRNVTGLLDALEADGFIVRSPHPTDRRATLVRLTERATAATATLNAEYQEGAAFLFGDVAAADLDTFVSIVDRVLARLRAVASATPGEPA